MFLNASIPPIECYVRGEYLRDLQDSFDKKFNCTIFGVASIPHKVPLFHFIMEDGGIWWRAPISAFCHKENAIAQDIHELMLWDSFSYYISVHAFDYLKNFRMGYLRRDKKFEWGTYLFTLDWCSGDPNITDTNYSEVPDQHKCGHVIKLDNGNYAIQPNNRVRVFDPSFTIKKDLLIERKVNTHVWTVENTNKWVTSDDDKYEYEVKPNK